MCVITAMELFAERRHSNVQAVFNVIYLNKKSLLFMLDNFAFKKNLQKFECSLGEVPTDEGQCTYNLIFY